MVKIYLEEITANDTSQVIIDGTASNSIASPLPIFGKLLCNLVTVDCVLDMAHRQEIIDCQPRSVYPTVLV